MVLVEDVSSSSNSNETNNSNSSTNRSSTQSPQGASTSFLQKITEQKSDFVLLLSRLATILFALLYFFQSFRSTNDANVYYNKALLSSLVTSALRLRQRIPAFQMSREFFLHVIGEDSAHYLMYSLFFLSGSPMTIVLIPISTYAFLHSCAFLSQFVNDYPAIKQKLERVTANHAQIFRFVALNEIILMPLLILSIFVARSNLLLIFMYYRFLTLRYTSRRNPYTKILFTELRIAAEQFCSQPACPAFVARLCHSSIQFINRLAPM